MAAECSEEAILDYVRSRGGKVRNSDLIEHFKEVFPEEPEKRAVVRESFKKCVDNIAFVKSEDGVKYVCLKKKFRGSVKAQHGSGEAKVTYRQPAASRSAQVSDAQVDPADEQRAALRSGSGNDSQVRVQHQNPAASTSEDRGDLTRECCETVGVVEEEVEVDESSADMGNAESFQTQKRVSGRQQAGGKLDIPDTSVFEASPLSARGAVFSLPEPAQTGSTGQVDAGPAGLGPTCRQVETSAGQDRVVTRRQSWKGSRFYSRRAEADDAPDEGQLDAHSLSGSEGNSSPKCSRQHFIQAMINSSPDVRRSLVLRNSVCLPSRTESDSVFLGSHMDDDRSLVTLEPLEHEWMMCASDGDWSSLYRLLTVDPSLVLRKDFVTGFTCLHWAAKHGKPELIALILNFARQHDIPVSVDVRSSTGYTPLHVAAMHNHMEVVKLLVGAYSANVEIRDYSGRKACQYLTDSVSVDIRDIIGAYEHCDLESTENRRGSRWRLSKVLQSNLKPLRLLSPTDCDSVDRDDQSREKPLRRKSSLSKMKPKLQKLRNRTSQIVHSTSFHETEELSRKGSMKGSFKARPMTHFFG